MSRSRKKSPYSGNTYAKSERFDKQMWHRRLRNQEKRSLERGEFEEHVGINKKEVSSVWLMHKDGKTRYQKEGKTFGGCDWADIYEKNMRK